MLSKIKKVGAIVTMCFVRNGSASGAGPLRHEMYSGWKFRPARLAGWYPTAVPETVHFDLMDNGLKGHLLRNDRKRVRRRAENFRRPAGMSSSATAFSAYLPCERRSDLVPTSTAGNRVRRLLSFERI